MFILDIRGAAIGHYCFLRGLGVAPSPFCHWNLERNECHDDWRRSWTTTRKITDIIIRFFCTSLVSSPFPYVQHAQTTYSWSFRSLHFKATHGRRDWHSWTDEGRDRRRRPIRACQRVHGESSLKFSRQTVDSVWTTNPPVFVAADESGSDTSLVPLLGCAPRGYRLFGVRGYGSCTRHWVIAAIASTW